MTIINEVLDRFKKWADAPVTGVERVVYTKAPQLMSTLNNAYVKALLTIGVAVWLKYEFEKSWGVCIFVLGSILLHENGHSWAAKCSDMRVGGIWFIPFFGAVTVIKDDPENILTNYGEWVIYFMGPLWGSAPAILLYWCMELFHPEILRWANSLTQEDHTVLYGLGEDLVVAVQLTVLINFVNLLPIPLLDGGRMLMSVVLSIEKKWHFLLTGALSACIVAYLLLAVKSILLAVGSGLVLQSFWTKRRQQIEEERMNSPNILLCLLLHAVLMLATVYVAMYVRNPIPKWYL